MIRAGDFIVITAGLFAAPFFGGILIGADRILTARFQSRIGPPLLQPFFDVAKLFGKEKRVVNIWQAFCVYCYLAAVSIAFVLFFLRSDLLLILLIHAVGAVFLVVGAFSAASPFSQIGASRELLQILSYEPLLIFAAVGIYLQTGSFKIDSVYALGDPLLPKLPFLFIAAGYALLVKLRKSPFDLSTSHQAHQELVKGLLTDYSGPFLGLVEIGHWYESMLFFGFCSLFWATGPVGMAVVAALTFISGIVIDNVCARLSWRWMLGYAWATGLFLSLVNLIWLYAR